MNDKVFTEYSVPRAVFTMAVPTMLSMLVTVFYNLADTFFVGQTGDPYQVAAVSLCSPYFLIFTALANIFGQGGTSCISRALGQGDMKKVKHFSAFAFYGAIFAGIILAVITLITINPLLGMLGCSENTFTPAKEYLSVIAYGGCFVTLSNTLSNLARAEGDAKSSMAGMIIGTVVNIILDPIMILVLNMGVTGAALATNLGNIVAAIYYIIHLKRSKTRLSMSPSDFTLKSEISIGLLSIGIPAFISNILMSGASIIYNNYVASYGDNPVAGMGIAQRANMVVFMVQMGLAIGISPLVGFAYGSKNLKKLKDVIKFSSLCTFVLGSVLTIIFCIFTRQIVWAFIQDEEVVRYGVAMLRAFMISGPLIGLMFVFEFTFQAMGKAKAALVLSLSRQGFVFLPVLIILNRAFGLNGIIYTQPIADIASLIMSFLMFVFIFKKLKQEYEIGGEIIND